MSDQFEYVNRYYGLHLRRGSPVQMPNGKHGRVVSSDGQYIRIRWDGDAMSTGPYHPTDELTYPQEPNR